MNLIKVMIGLKFVNLNFAKIYLHTEFVSETPPF